ncbi:hypothetical protein FHU38_005240 [Saccharomonospora amisosensis]|uniref:Uncharacterized protein n=1 Tax=Saccharomonospora amisosensis TaxID=1128677 RepID=A0A7X5ZTD2_9PSEU|nr:hypothetical protein [Saccharomonospora amisosensis]
MAARRARAVGGAAPLAAALASAATCAARRAVVAQPSRTPAVTARRVVAPLVAAPAAAVRHGVLAVPVVGVVVALVVLVPAVVVPHVVVRVGELRGGVAPRGAVVAFLAAVAWPAGAGTAGGTVPNPLVLGSAPPVEAGDPPSAAKGPGDGAAPVVPEGPPPPWVQAVCPAVWAAPGARRPGNEAADRCASLQLRRH